MSNDTVIAVTKPFRGNKGVYTFSKIIAEGFSGEVLLGVSQTDRQVVIKRPNQRSIPTQQDAQEITIQRERDALQQLWDNGVRDTSELLDQGEAYYEYQRKDGKNSYKYFVTSFAPGHALTYWVEPDHALPWLDVLSVLERFAGVLQRAHELGLVYNDAKLDHLFWDPEQKKFTLIDWGNVVFFGKGESDKTAQDDIRQFGGIVYELITGRPYAGGGTGTITRDVANLPLKDEQIELRDLLIRIDRGAIPSASELKKAVIEIRSNVKRQIDVALFELDDALQQSSRDIDQLKRQLDNLESQGLDDDQLVKIRQLRAQIDTAQTRRERETAWHIIKAYLDASDWREAQQQIKQLLQNNDPEESESRLQRLDRLITWLIEKKGTRKLSKPLQKQVAQLLFENKDGLLIAQELWSKKLEADSLIEIIYVLDINTPFYLIQPELERLGRQEIDFRQEYRSASRVLRNAFNSIEDARDEFKWVKKDEKLTLETWQNLQRVYNNVITHLENVRDVSDIPDLSHIIHRLINGSRQIVAHLKRANEEINSESSYFRIAQPLAEASKLDPGNFVLKQMADRFLELAREIEYLPDLEEENPIDSFTSWLNWLDDKAENVPYIESNLQEARKLWKQYREALSQGQIASARSRVQDIETFLWLLPKAGKEHLRFLQDDFSIRPWFYETSPQIRQVIRQSLHDWQQGSIDKMVFPVEAQTARDFYWLDRLNRLKEDTQTLLRNPLNQRSTSQSVSGLPQTDFVRLWSSVIQKFRNWRYSDVKNDVADIIQKFNEYSFYRPHLFGLQHLAQINERFIKEELNLTRLDQVYRLLENPELYEQLRDLDVNNVYRFSLESYRHTIELIQQAFQFFELSDFESARKAINKAHQELIEIPHSNRQFSAYVNGLKDGIDKSIQVLRETTEQVQAMGLVSDDAWHLLNAGLEKASYQVSNQPEFNRILRQVQLEHQQLIKAGTYLAYVQSLNDLARTNPNHPYLSLYKEWHPTVPADNSNREREKDKDEGLQKKPEEDDHSNSGRLWLFLLASAILLMLSVGCALLAPQIFDRINEFQAVSPTETTQLVINTAVVPTPEPSHSSTPISISATLDITPSSTPSPGEQLLERCLQMQSAASNLLWEDVLLKSKEARDNFGGEIVNLTQEISPECDLIGLVTSAGEQLAVLTYNEGAYDHTEIFVQQTEEMLRFLLSDSWQISWKLDLMRHCAVYQLNRESSWQIAFDALIYLEDSWGDRAAFQNDINELCGFSFEVVKNELSDLLAIVTAPEVSHVTYEVRPGDTVQSISTRFGVTVEDISNANGLFPPYNIYPGDILIIPTNASPTSTPTFTPTSFEQPTPSPTPSPAITIDQVNFVGQIDQENIRLRNTSNEPVILDGWVLTDDQGNTFNFPQGTEINGDDSIFVYTKSGPNSGINLYWGLEGAIWATGKTVYLKDQNGTIQHQFTIS